METIVDLEEQLDEKKANFGKLEHTYQVTRTEKHRL